MEDAVVIFGVVVVLLASVDKSFEIAATSSSITVTGISDVTIVDSVDTVVDTEVVLAVDVGLELVGFELDELISVFSSDDDEFGSVELKPGRLIPR